MAGYRELREGRSVVETDAGVECVQEFIEIASGVDSLPAIGDSFSVTKPTALSYSGSICRSRDFSYFWYDHSADVDYQKIVCKFSAKSGPALIPDTEQRRYSVGGEVVAIPRIDGQSVGEGWEWVVGGGVVNQDLYQSNVMGSFSIQKELASDAAKETYLALVEANAGKLNIAEFEGHRIGSVLFSGLSGGTQNDSGGSKIWLFELQFDFRIISGNDVAGNPIAQDDWRYLVDKLADGNGKWDKPRQVGATLDNGYLYDKADLTVLL